MQFCFPFTTNMFAFFGPIWEIVLKKEDGKRRQQTVMWLFLSKELSREWVDLILLLRIVKGVAHSVSVITASVFSISGIYFRRLCGARTTHIWDCLCIVLFGFRFLKTDLFLLS